MDSTGENKFEIKNGKIRKPLVVVDDFSIINEPSSELLSDTLNKLNVKGEILIAVDNESYKNSNLLEAAEKLSNVKVMLVTQMTSKDVLAADYLVITEPAVKEVSERLS